MITIGRMPVPVMGVIDVVPVRYRIVAAARAVRVAVGGMSQMRQRMLVVMAIMRRVRVSLVHVVDMSLALGARVSAARAVLVLVIVNVMVGGCHPSSLL
jgi:hypothetical protein